MHFLQRQLALTIICKTEHNPKYYFYVKDNRSLLWSSQSTNLHKWESNEKYLLDLWQIVISNIKKPRARLQNALKKILVKLDGD